MIPRLHAALWRLQLTTGFLDHTHRILDMSGRRECRHCLVVSGKFSSVSESHTDGCDVGVVAAQLERTEKLYGYQALVNLDPPPADAPVQNDEELLERHAELAQLARTVAGLLADEDATGWRGTHVRNSAVNMLRLVARALADRVEIDQRSGERHHQ